MANVSLQAEVEETLKRIQTHKGVIGTIVVNAEGKLTRFCVWGLARQVLFHFSHLFFVLFCFRKLLSYGITTTTQSLVLSPIKAPYKTLFIIRNNVTCLLCHLVWCHLKSCWIGDVLYQHSMVVTAICLFSSFGRNTYQDHPWQLNHGAVCRPPPSVNHKGKKHRARYRPSEWLDIS